VVVFAGVVVALACIPLACSTSQALLGSGQTCLAATDCQPGLVCVPENGQNGQGGPRVCSDDLSGVQKTETNDSGNAAMGEGGGGEGGGGSEGGGGGTTDGTAPSDTGTTSTDTGTGGG
jgi:hypothetical protein